MLVTPAVVWVVPNCVNVIPSSDRKNCTLIPDAPLSTSRVALTHFVEPSVKPVATLEVEVINVVPLVELYKDNLPSVPSAKLYDNCPPLAHFATRVFSALGVQSSIATCTRRSISPTMSSTAASGLDK